jgi:hypothetical protein
VGNQLPELEQERGRLPPLRGGVICRRLSLSRTQWSVSTRRQVRYPATLTAPRDLRLVERVSLGTGRWSASSLRLGVSADVPLRPGGLAWALQL